MQKKYFFRPVILITLIVTCISCIVNHIPVANAGDDQTVLPGDTVFLDGSGSTDTGGDTLNYSWDFILKPSESNATLSYSYTVNPFFIADQAGIYKIHLVVNDGIFNSEPDEVIITAEPLSTIEPTGVPTPEPTAVPTAEPTSAPDTIWIEIPSGGVQCADFVYPSLQKVIAGLEENGITVLEAREIYYVVCTACGCPNGIGYAALIYQKDLALAEDLGWSIAEIEPPIWIERPSGGVQCADFVFPSLQKVIAGLEENGITVLEATEIHYVVCTACGCPNGLSYAALIYPKDLALAETLGWSVCGGGCADL